MSAAPRKPDDGSVKWARDEAVRAIARASERAWIKGGPRQGARVLSELSLDCLKLIHGAPALYRAHYGSLVHSEESNESTS